MDATNKSIDLLDALNLISFIIGYLNYEENLTQTDKQQIMKAFDEQTHILLADIHAHLEKHEMYLKRITEVLKIENYKEDYQTD